MNTYTISAPDPKHVETDDTPGDALTRVLAMRKLYGSATVFDETGPIVPVWELIKRRDYALAAQPL